MNRLIQVASNTGLTVLGSDCITLGYLKETTQKYFRIFIFPFFFFQGPEFTNSLLPNIIVKEEEINKNLYMSHLVVENIQFDYTGLYICRLKDMPRHNISIYVFAEGLFFCISLWNLPWILP